MTVALVVGAEIVYLRVDKTVWLKRFPELDNPNVRWPWLPGHPSALPAGRRPDPANECILWGYVTVNSLGVTVLVGSWAVSPAGGGREGT